MTTYEAIVTIKDKLVHVDNPESKWDLFQLKLRMNGYDSTKLSLEEATKPASLFLISLVNAVNLL